jgi:hypothetical protein
MCGHVNGRKIMVYKTKHAVAATVRNGWLAAPTGAKYAHNYRIWEPHSHAKFFRGHSRPTSPRDPALFAIRERRSLPLRAEISNGVSRYLAVTGQCGADTPRSGHSVAARGAPLRVRPGCDTVSWSWPILP